MRLRGNWTTLFGLEEHGTLRIHVLSRHLTMVLLGYRVFQGLGHLRRILTSSFHMLHTSSGRLRGTGLLRSLVEMTRAVQNSRWISRLVEEALRCRLVQAVMVPDILEALVVSHFGALLGLLVLLRNQPSLRRIHLTVIDLDIAQLSLHQGSPRRLLSRSDPLGSPSVGVVDVLLPDGAFLQVAWVIILAVGLVVVARITVDEE